MLANQIVAARGLLRWTQSELASRSGVSNATIRRFEAMDGEVVGNVTTLRALEHAMEAAGVVFLDDGAQVAGGPGVRLRKS